MILLMIPSILAAPPVSEAALLPGDDAVGGAAGDQYDPALARGPDSWLLIWEDTRATLAGTVGTSGAASVTDIYGIRLDESGIPLDAVAFPISSLSFLETDPRAAWSGADWLVAWNGDRETKYYRTQDVQAARVGSDGGVLDAAPITVIGSDEDESLWDVASDGENWAVLWQEADGDKYVLDGAIVAADGGVGAAVRVHTPTYNTYTPWNVRFAWSDDRYLIAWEEWGESDHDVAGLLVDEALDPLGAYFLLSAGSSDDVKPAVDAANGEFYVAWKDGGVGGYWGGVEGTPVDLDGDPAAPGGVLLSADQYPIDPHPDVSWAGDRWAISWENWGYPAGFSLNLSWADPDGELLGWDPAFSGLDYATTPAMAGTDGGALMAWVDRPVVDGLAYGLDIVAVPVASDGTLGDVQDASTGAPAQISPEIAGDHRGYLLVAYSHTAAESRLLAWPLGAFGEARSEGPIELLSGPVAGLDVAWNGSVYLVVWEDSSQVYGLRVSPEGEVLDAAPVALLHGDSPAVAAAGDTFLVVSSYAYLHHSRSIEAVRVSGEGALLDAAPVTVGQTYATDPDVAGFDSGWIVGWSRFFSHDSPYSEARIAVVSADGVNGPDTLVRTYDSTPTQTSVAVATDGETALVTWADDDIWARQVAADGKLLGAALGFAVSAADNEQFDPAVAWTGLDYWVAWTDWRIHSLLEPGEGDVYAAQVSGDGAVLDPDGLAIAADAAAPEGNAAIAASRGTTLIAWAKLHEEAPYAAFRVETTWSGPTLARVAGGLEVTGAEPGDTVRFLAGTSAGDAHCPADAAGLCLEIGEPVVVLGEATTDASGTASIAWEMGEEELIQALVVRAAGEELAGRTQPLNVGEPTEPGDTGDPGDTGGVVDTADPGGEDDTGEPGGPGGGGEEADGGAKDAGCGGCATGRSSGGLAASLGALALGLLRRRRA